MCICNGSQVVVLPLAFGSKIIPCPYCNDRELPEHHPDYHPGQSMRIRASPEEFHGYEEASPK